MRRGTASLRASRGTGKNDVVKRPASNCIRIEEVHGHEAYGDGLMVHDTPARKKARKNREDAHKLAKDAQTLAGIEGLESEAKVRLEKAKELMEQARVLQENARLEDVSVRQVDYWKKTKKGDRNYPRWVCSWQECDKIITRYLGSCKKMSQPEAEQKAKRLKAEALGTA